MLLQPLDLTTALRPELLPGENLLFVQDAIGLYEGLKFKIPSHQHGHGYLTTHRICYVDNAEPRVNSSAIDLKEVDQYEFYAGFLKSSAKITLFPKPPKRTLHYSPSQHGPSLSVSDSVTRQSASHSSSPKSSVIRSSQSQTEIPSRPQDSTWICPICSFSNPVPINFDPITANAQSPIPPCLACGIKPPLVHVLKAAISSRSSTHSTYGNTLQQRPKLSHGVYASEYDVGQTPSRSNVTDSSTPESSSVICHRCTFLNHPSLLSCELCSASLVSANQLRPSSDRNSEARAESPGPSLQVMKSAQEDIHECIKLSFRAGGEKVFYERLKVAMVQRRWLLQTVPPTVRPQIADPKTGQFVEQAASDVKPKSGGGIAGLERRGTQFRENNQLVIGNAFEDLEALMSSAKEIIALAEDFASRSSSATPEASAILSESAAALGMITTKDMLGSNSSSDTLYISELARTLAEYLTDDQRGILKKEGGIMSLVDLWAVFNRARNGVELINPEEFEKAARQWEQLGLPVRLRKFKNGLLVVQRYDWTDDKIIAHLLAWLQDLHVPITNVEWDASTFGHGVTAVEAAAKFGWSVGVATEELEMAEEKGALCREEGVEGIRFWENHIISEMIDG